MGYLSKQNTSLHEQRKTTAIKSEKVIEVNNFMNTRGGISHKEA